MRRKRTPSPPVDVLAALREIGRHAADATHQAMLGAYQPHQARAIQASLKTASKLRSLAPAAAAHALAREEEDPQVGNAWRRQWERKDPPTEDDEELLIEGPLWYLALTLRQLRRTLERAPDGSWMASADELKLIAQSQGMATLALGALPMEAIVLANQHRREEQAKRQPAPGPALKPAKLAKVRLLSV